MSDSASSVRHRFADFDTIMMKDEHEHDHEHDELKPLSPSSHNDDGRNHVVVGCSKRTSTLVQHDERVNCFGSLWRLIASVGLALLLVLPFLYSFYQHTYHTQFNIPDYPSDTMKCAHDYNISFAQLHHQIEHAKQFCGNDDHSTCTCTPPLEPIARVPGTPQYFQKWDQTHRRNRKVAAQASSARVVLYGDSIVEHLGGTDLGVASQETMSVKKQFDAVFDGDAVVLGLAGDRVSTQTFVVCDAI